jgi:hypothetical protein
MPWYAIIESAKEVGRVFVISDHDLESQLRPGQTAEEATAPFVTEDTIDN